MNNSLDDQVYNKIHSNNLYIDELKNKTDKNELINKGIIENRIINYK